MPTNYPPQPDATQTDAHPGAGTLARRTAQALALFSELVAIREMAGRNADYLRTMDAAYLLTLIHDKAAAAVAAHQADSRAEVAEVGGPDAGEVQP